MPEITMDLMQPCLFRLPVSGQLIALRQPTGAEDLLLLESGGDDTGLALALAERLALPVSPSASSVPPHSGGAFNWRESSVTDLDALIAYLRQTVIGDHVRADIDCAQERCGKRIDVSFSIGQYLAHHRPAKPRARRGWNVEAAAEDGWYRLSLARSVQPVVNAAEGIGSAVRWDASEHSSEVLFRLPTVADQVAVAGSTEAMEELARRCIRPSRVSRRLRRQAEAAMQAMAPSLSDELRGSCPECGEVVSVFFDPRRFFLRELRERAAFIYQDINVLAGRYHWSETDILELPHVRRTCYAEMARQDAGVS